MNCHAPEEYYLVPVIPLGVGAVRICYTKSAPNRIGLEVLHNPVGTGNIVNPEADAIRFVEFDVQDVRGVEVLIAGLRAALAHFRASIATAEGGGK